MASSNLLSLALSLCFSPTQTQPAKPSSASIGSTKPTLSSKAMPPSHPPASYD
nr:unnamed protein product [Phaseolus vulgaris]